MLDNHSRAVLASAVTRTQDLASYLSVLYAAAESLTVEHAGEPLSRYEVRVEAGTGESRSVARPRLFESSHKLRRPQQHLFALDSLGEGG